MIHLKKKITLSQAFPYSKYLMALKQLLMNSMVAVINELIGFYQIKCDYVIECITILLEQ